MAGAGYKAFADGDVLTAAQVQTFLQDQAVMRFADSSARTTALGTAVAEGMVSYLQDTDAVEVYDGSAWTALGGGGFTASTAITATDASWSVPTLADPVVRVTCVGGGAGGGSISNGASGAVGNPSSFGAHGTAVGGTAQPVSRTPVDAPDSIVITANGGEGYAGTNNQDGWLGGGGEMKWFYANLDGVSTVNVTVGAGGAGAGSGADGGDGVVIVEYRAG